MEETSSHKEKIIELTQIVQDGKGDPKTSELSIDKPIDKLEDLSNVEQVKPSAQADSLTVDKIPSDLLENVLEKWVQKEFQGKIEPLLQEVVERVVEREMRRIGQNIEKKMDKIQMISENESEC